jgi:hypothetical protein
LFQKTSSRLILSQAAADPRIIHRNIDLGTGMEQIGTDTENQPFEDMQLFIWLPGMINTDAATPAVVVPILRQPASTSDSTVL